MSTGGKIFARVCLPRLQRLAEQIYTDSQSGFRAERPTIDMIFSLRQLEEKCREQKKSLYVAFIDLTRAFDLVSRDGLFKMLERIGCPPKLLAIVGAFHVDMKATVHVDPTTSGAFDIRSGVKQGCVLAPTLFGIFSGAMINHALSWSPVGILLHCRSSGKLFNLSRFKSKTKIVKVLIRELLIADDAAIVTHAEEDLQKLLDNFSRACTDFGLTIRLKETQMMSQSTVHPPVLHINGYELEDVLREFTYLGSKMTENATLC